MNAILAGFLVVVAGQGLVVGDPNELLLTVSNVGQSATINVASRKAPPSPFFCFTEPLSQACSDGEHTTRCRKLFMMTLSNETYLVVVPLQTKLGVIELQYNGTDLVERQKSEAEITIPNCVVLDVFTVDGKVVAPCIRESSLFSCQLNLTSFGLSCSQFTNLNRQYTADDYPYVTNFVYSEDHRQFLFAIRGDVYGMDYRHGVVNSLGNLGEDANCERVDYLGNYVLFAYCGSRRAVELDIGIETSLYTLNEGTGIPFTCPMSGRRVTVREMDGTIVLRRGVEFESGSTNFTYGECYSDDLFFFVDYPQGIGVLNASSAHFIPNSSRTSNVVLFEEAYVVALRNDPLEVVLFDASFQPIVRQRGRAAVVGILPNLSTPPTNPDPTPIALGIVIPLVIVIVGVIVVGIAVGVYRHRHRGEHQLQGRPPERNPIGADANQDLIQQRQDPLERDEPPPQVPLVQQHQDPLERDEPPPQVPLVQQHQDPLERDEPPALVPHEVDSEAENLRNNRCGDGCENTDTSSLMSPVQSTADYPCSTLVPGHHHSLSSARLLSNT